jgi:ABC-type antimicrobial peptide transport system permease subunit
VLRQGLALTSIGLCLGIALSLALAGSLGRLLYGIDGRDPVTYVVVSLFLVFASALACIAPALRAARLDPLVVLKQG